jgi:hypothetical protein
MTTYAQKFDKKYTEEFNTNADVVIDVDTRHTDIQIETWNKNKVSIEATIEIEGASKEKAEEIIKNWKFKVLGNKNVIEIISKTNSLFTNSRAIHINGDVLRIEENDFDFVMPEVSIGNLGVLDSFDVVMPDVFVFPEPLVFLDVDSFHFDFDMPDFDYEKYKNDKNYMKNWQKKMKKNLEKIRKVEWNVKSVKIKERSAKLKEELKTAQEKRKKALQKHAKERKKILEEHTKERKKMAKIRKEVHEKRREELAKNRLIIKNVLADRDKIKIKRIIKIKAPKNAKFNMNVRYGSMSFPN